MYRKLLLPALLFFPSIIISDIAVLHKSKLPTPVFDLTKANHPNKKTKVAIAPFWEKTKKNNAVDTAALKQSNWYADVVKNIEASEYEIKKDDKTGLYVAPNRQQQLRASFIYNSFTLQPRSEEKGWTLKMQLNGIYTNKKLIAQPEEDDLPVIGSNKIVFSNTIFSTEYVNSKEGVRQNFIITKKPDGQNKKISLQLTTNKGWYINKVHDKELHFAKHEGDQLSKKITYNSLKVWDANNKELVARFVVNKKHTAFEIEVNTADAVYPITIDPISTGTSGTPDWTGSDANQPGARYGINVSSAGDVNGDGYSDVIVGAYLYDDAPNTDEGRAFVYHGSATGLSATANSILQDANQPGASFGESVNTAGDVNGDGYSDVIVGAYLYDDAGNADEGVAFVYHGSATGLILTPTILDDVNQAGAQLGFLNAVASAGDINGDGYSDVIVGARLYDAGNTDEGRAWVYYGSASGLSAIPDVILDDANQDGAQFGAGVASAGDVNGDGYSDVIVGAPFYDDGPNANEGWAFVYYGSISGLSTIPASILDDANVASSLFGYSVNSAGDVNGDGYSDVIIGAYTFTEGANTNEGRAFVYQGSSTGLSATPNSLLDDADQAFAGLGIRVASAGDVNGDGYSDVIVGVYQYDDGGNADEGVAYIYFGSTTGLGVSPGAVLDDANQPGANLGSGAASAGDVNGDGYSDVIVGAWWYDDAGNTDEGRAYVYHGSPDGLSASPVNTPDDADQSGANFGVSVASAGDVNGDGYSDVIIGAWRYDDAPHFDEGVAFVYHGSPTGLPATPNSMLDDANQAGAFFGETVGSAGDVNGDGYSDVIIGADNYDDGFSNEGVAFVYHGGPSGLSNSPASMLDDANQANAYFGVSVATAGDINGDGYGDVIVGAIGITDGGNADEGRAYIYHGSSTGLSATPNSTPDDADQPGAWFGWSVAGAGDVNGDGYSDVIIGALSYDEAPNTNEGRAFVYHGSATGLSATPNSTPDDADQIGAQFGECVATAGDVNGDGYSDVIIGAKLYDDGFADEGRAFVYYGSSAGLGLAPVSTPDDADQPTAHFGISVASAGDVNGDGYSDVIIGARYYDDGANNNEGRAFVYYGSSTGLSTTPNSTPDDADQANTDFGYSVACAGDINGDGYSDVIVGAFLYNGGTSFEGQAFVYYGNYNGGLKNNLRLYNTDLVTPIQRFNFTEPNLFGAGLFSKSPLGRVKGKLVWEVKSQGQAFSGNPITNSTAYLGKASNIDLGIAGVELKSNVQKVGRQNKVRVRVEYDKVTAITGQVYGPWRYPAAYLQGAHGMNSIPLPVKLNWFNGALVADKVKLQWSSSDDENVATYQIERSNNNSNFAAIGTVSSVHQNNKPYNFTDEQPLKGTSWYRLKITDEYSRINYSGTIVIKNNNDAVWIYPTVISKGQTINLQFKNNVTGALEIQLLNSAGAVVFKKALAANGNTLTVELPSLSSGIYILTAMQNGEKLITQKIIIR